MKTKYSLTEEHRAQLGPWRDRWIANALRATPLTDVEKRSVEAAIRGLYEAAGLPRPINIVWAKGPVSGALAAGIAAGVWYLREHGLPGLNAATEDATRAATSAATSAATFAATLAATRAATRAATSAATRAATFDATSAATFDATEDATEAATRAATEAATRAATEAATEDATSAATFDATRAATRAATSAATRAATFDATSAATRAATSAATRAATFDATSAATFDATEDATEAATRAATSAATSFLLRCCAGWARMVNGGSQWSGWVAYLSFFRWVAGLGIDYSRWQHYEVSALAGPRYMHPRFCIVSELPATLRQEVVAGRGRPHCATGPSHEWADGVRLYYWHGVKVPAEWIEHKDKLDPKTALTWSNIEQRRAAAEIIGWARVLASLDARTIDVDPDPEIGTLLEVDLPDSPGERFLRVRCGTGRDFCLPVGRAPKTALEANALTYGITTDLLKTKEHRT